MAGGWRNGRWHQRLGGRATWSKGGACCGGGVPGGWPELAAHGELLTAEEGGQHGRSFEAWRWGSSRRRRLAAEEHAVR
jgi:hypothetical protein